MNLLSSTHNPHVKDAIRLREGRQRRSQGRILIDGLRELGCALRAGVRLIEVFVCPALCESPEAQSVIAAISAPTEIFQVTEAVFGKLAFGDRKEGLLGVAQTPERSLDQLELPPDALVAVVEGIEKPGNLGAILRSADGAGVAALIAVDPQTDLYNPNAIRASLGTIFSLPVYSASAAEACDWLHRQQFAIFAAKVDGAVPYTAANYCGRAAIVVGSEAEGLTAAWSSAEVKPIRIPMSGKADSLNVAAAAAVLFYEAQRQRMTR